MATSKKQSLGKSIIKNLVKGKDKIEEVVKSITHSSPKKKTSTPTKTSTPKMTSNTRMTSASKKTSTGKGQTKKK